MDELGKRITLEVAEGTCPDCYFFNHAYECPGEFVCQEVECGKKILYKEVKED